MPKAIMSEDSFGRHELLGFDDDRWARIRSQIPQTLSAKVEARLRTDIMECCSWFLTQRAQLQRGTETAAATQGRGKHEVAPLERLLKALKKTAAARDEVSKILDDRRGIYETLDLMIWDLESRLTLKPVTVLDPFPEFVCKVAVCLRNAGLKPTATGGVYEHAKPSWFQQFMAALDKELLGSRNLLSFDDRTGKQFENDHRAFYAEIAKAHHGYKKAGFARK
jgi:hypothetical protein